MRSLPKLPSILAVASIALFGATSIAQADEPGEEHIPPSFGPVQSSAEPAWAEYETWYHGTITFTDTISAPEGLAEAYLYVSQPGEREAGEAEEWASWNEETTGLINMESGLSNTQETVTFQVNTAELEDGADCFEFAGRTTAGQFARSGEEYCVNVSNTAPGKVSTLENAHGDGEAAPTWSNEAFNFRLTNDDPAPISTAYYTVNGGPVHQGTFLGYAYEEEGSEIDQFDTEPEGLPEGGGFEQLPEGTDELCAWLGDEAGNSDQSNETCFTTQVDHEAPTIGSMSWSSATDTLSAPVSDNLSGVIQGEVYFVSPTGEERLVEAVIQNGVASASLSEAAPGEWTAVLFIEDAASNESAEELTFTVAATGDTGTGNPGTGNPGTANTGNTAIGNTGNTAIGNTGAADTGTTNTGNAGTAPASTGSASTAAAGKGQGSKPKPGIPHEVEKPQVKMPKKVKVGSVIKAAAGRWKSQGKTSYSYRWQIHKGNHWITIKDATTATLKVAAAEAGRQIRVGVRARNTHGHSAWSYSRPFKA